MTARRRAALRKAQMASARKRKGKSRKRKIIGAGAGVAVGVLGATLARDIRRTEKKRQRIRRGYEAPNFGSNVMYITKSFRNQSHFDSWLMGGLLSQAISDAPKINRRTRVKKRYNKIRTNYLFKRSVKKTIRGL